MRPRARNTRTPSRTPVAPRFKQAAIVGVGLIGGSLGMVLKQLEMASVVIGIGRRIENLHAAVRLGAIDRFVEEPKEGIQGADLVILATPVDTYERHLKAWGSAVRPGTIVTDVGSVKGALVKTAEELLPKEAFFVGAHPIAGKEKTGVLASSVDLFQGARCIVTPTGQSNPRAVETIRALWEAAGSRVVEMDPFVHDQVLGAVSHLPHVVAFSLMTALEEIHADMVPDLDLLAYGGGGLRDTSRIAASSPEMWRDICLWNRENLVKMLDIYQRHVDRFKGLIESGDGPGLEQQMGQAKQIRNQVQ